MEKVFFIRPSVLRYTWNYTTFQDNLVSTVLIKLIGKNLIFAHCIDKNRLFKYIILNIHHTKH
jgi:hypothetical protein